MPETPGGRYYAPPRPKAPPKAPPKKTPSRPTLSKEAAERRAKLTEAAEARKKVREAEAAKAEVVEKARQAEERVKAARVREEAAPGVVAPAPLVISTTVVGAPEPMGLGIVKLKPKPKPKPKVVVGAPESGIIGPPHVVPTVPLTLGPERWMPTAAEVEHYEEVIKPKIEAAVKEASIEKAEEYAAKGSVIAAAIVEKGKGIIYSYEEGGFVPATPEEVAEREEFYIAHPGIAPPGTPGKGVPLTAAQVEQLDSLVKEYETQSKAFEDKWGKLLNPDTGQYEPKTKGQYRALQADIEGLEETFGEYSTISQKMMGKTFAALGASLAKETGAREEIAPYLLPSGQVNIAAALSGGVSPEVFRTLGIPSEDIEAAKVWAVGKKEREVARGTLAPFYTPGAAMWTMGPRETWMGGYDIGGALGAGIPASVVLAAGFTGEQVERAQAMFALPTELDFPPTKGPAIGTPFGVGVGGGLIGGLPGIVREEYMEPGGTFIGPAGVPSYPYYEAKRLGEMGIGRVVPTIPIGGGLVGGLASLRGPTPEDIAYGEYGAAIIGLEREYQERFGLEPLLKSRGVEAASIFFAPARGLLPEHKVTPLEWIIGGVQVAGLTAPLWAPAAGGTITTAAQPLRQFAWARKIVPVKPITEKAFMKMWWETPRTTSEVERFLLKASGYKGPTITEAMVGKPAVLTQAEKILEISRLERMWGHPAGGLPPRVLAAQMGVEVAAPKWVPVARPALAPAVIPIPSVIPVVTPTIVPWVSPYTLPGLTPTPSAVAPLVIPGPITPLPGPLVIPSPITPIVAPVPEAEPEAPIPVPVVPVVPEVEPEVIPGVTPIPIVVPTVVPTPGVIPTPTPTPAPIPIVTPTPALLPITIPLPSPTPFPVFGPSPIWTPEPVTAPVIVPFPAIWTPPAITPPISFAPFTPPPPPPTPPPLMPPPFLWPGLPGLGAGFARLRRPLGALFGEKGWIFPELVISFPEPFGLERKRVKLAKKRKIPYGAKRVGFRVAPGTKMVKGLRI